LLSNLQRHAIEAITACCGRFQTLVLRGVTGSGKTEVYLGAIEAVLARGEQALVLVPEIALTPQLVARFAARLATPLAVLHSSLNDSERLAAWRNAFQGTAGVVIGTRSAVFAPLARPGIIIVDEEHDASYKQQEGFRYSARDLAITRAQRHGIPVVLGSATPALESLELIDRGRALALELPQRAGNAREPTLTLIDLRKHPSTHGISTPALLRARHHLERGGQVLFFLNRRGYAPVLFCPGCGWAAACVHCDARLTVHQRTRTLRCHHCGDEQPVASQCPKCASPVKPVGAGTERIEEILGNLFPNHPQVRIDRDVIRHRGELEEALERINSGTARVLIGTQMVTKGHDFPQLTLVVVLNADQGLFGSDIRSSERLAQTIVQVAGRAGRADAQGEVLIQTEYPEHPLLACLLTGGYAAFARAALEERRRAGWPPFSRLALLRADAKEHALALQFLAAAKEAGERLNDGQVHLRGPAAAPMERRGDRFRAQLLLQASSHQPLQKLLSRWLPILESLPQARQVRWSIDVDPAELL
jgi:primosomal protein N' (replication factor Y)